MRGRERGGRVLQISATAIDPASRSALESAPSDLTAVKCTWASASSRAVATNGRILASKDLLERLGPEDADGVWSLGSYPSSHSGWLVRACSARACQDITCENFDTSPPASVSAWSSSPHQFEVSAPGIP
jgi:hypothetical protein